jgi:ArsR family transcriptional regulator
LPVVDEAVFMHSHPQRQPDGKKLVKIPPQQDLPGYGGMVMMAMRQLAFELTRVHYILLFAHMIKYLEACLMNTEKNPQLTGDPPSCNVVHAVTVKRVSGQMPSETVLEDLAEFFKLFSDKTRIGILWALSFSEMCVCDLAMLLKMKQPAISQHLKNLRQMRIVRTRREGKVIYYALDDEHIRAVLHTGLQHIDEPVEPTEALQ